MTRKGLNELMRLIRYAWIAEGYQRGVSVAEIARHTGYSPESIPVLARRIKLPPHPNHGCKMRSARQNYVDKRRKRNRAAEKSYYVPTEPSPITLAGPKWSWPS